MLQVFETGPQLREYNLCNCPESLHLEGPHAWFNILQKLVILFEQGALHFFVCWVPQIM